MRTISRTRMRLCRFQLRPSCVLLFLTLGLVAPNIVVGQEEAKSTRILVLHHYGPEQAITPTLDRTLQEALRVNSHGPIEYYSEYLEQYRFAGDTYSPLLRDFLKNKYANQKPDVIIAVFDGALDFLLTYRNEMFPDVPIVYVVTRRRAEAPNQTGIWQGPTKKETLRLALRLQPNTKHVFVIDAKLNNDGTVERETRQQLQEFQDKVEIVYLRDLTIDEVKARVRALPNESIILYVRQGKAGPTTSMSAMDALSQIAQVSHVPIYGSADLQIGHGLVGGYVFDTQSIAKELARTALQITNGTTPQSIPVQTAQAVPMFDWRELKRYGISEKDLPVDSIVRSKEFSVWELYKWRIIGAISLIILQTILIVYLLIIRAKRSQAEGESMRFSTLMEAEHRRLEEIVANVQGIVWESRLVPGSTDRKTTFVSSYAEKMLGYSVNKWLSIPGFGFSLMPPEDRERTNEESDAVIRSGTDGVSQFRWIAKDGTVLWIETYLAAICDEAGATIGLRGISMDITDRKHAEEDLEKRRDELKEGQRIAVEGSWEWDPVENTVIWSEELFRIMG